MEVQRGECRTEEYRDEERRGSVGEDWQWKDVESITAASRLVPGSISRLPAAVRSVDLKIRNFPP